MSFMVAESVVCEVDVPLARTEGYPYIFQQTVECDIQNANELAYQVELMKRMYQGQFSVC